MPPYARPGEGDSLAAGRGRQRLKIAAIGYGSAQHGVDATVERAHTARDYLCKMAIEFVGALPGSLLKNRRIDLYRQGDSETLEFVAIAYTSSRHGIDADVGMAREGLAMLCQASIDFVESIPKEDPAPKRSSGPTFQLGNGARS